MSQLHDIKHINNKYNKYIKTSTFTQEIFYRISKYFQNIGCVGIWLGKCCLLQQDMHTTKLRSQLSGL